MAPCSLRATSRPRHPRRALVLGNRTTMGRLRGPPAALFPPAARGGSADTRAMGRGCLRQGLRAQDWQREHSDGGGILAALDNAVASAGDTGRGANRPRPLSRNAIRTSRGSCDVRPAVWSSMWPRGAGRSGAYAQCAIERSSDRCERRSRVCTRRRRSDTSGRFPKASSTR